MKIRNGFVSNSSSSSFIIKWKDDKIDLNNNSDKEKIDAVLRLFAPADQCQHCRSWLGISRLDGVEEYITFEEINGHNCVVAEFYTPMLNSALDISPLAGKLLVAMNYICYSDPNFEYTTQWGGEH